MRLLLSMFTSVLVLSVSAQAGFSRTSLQTAKPPVTPTPVIYKGQPIGPTSRTGKVSVILYMGSGSSCTGVVIRERAILTASHCFSEPEDRSGNLVVYFQYAADFVSWNTYSANQFKTHRRTTNTDGERHKDLAVVTFQNSILPDERFAPTTMVSTAYIQDFNQLYNRKLYIAGAGYNEYTLRDDKVDEGQLGKLFFTGVTYDRYDYDGLEVITKGSTRICKGDSGGGLFLQDGDEFILLGIFSAFIPDGASRRCGHYATFAPLNAENAQWIQGILESEIGF